MATNAQIPAPVVIIGGLSIAIMFITHSVMAIRQGSIDFGRPQARGEVRRFYRDKQPIRFWAVIAFDFFGAVLLASFAIKTMWTGQGLR